MNLPSGEYFGERSEPFQSTKDFFDPLRTLTTDISLVVQALAVGFSIWSKTIRLLSGDQSKLPT